MNRLIKQQKQTWHSLAKKPGFVATVVTTMGLTLGALLCVMTLAYLLLFEPLPYPDQQRLYKVDHGLNGATGERKNTVYTYPGLLYLYENQQIFDQAAMVYRGDDILTSNDNQPRMQISHVTEQWFHIVDAPMALGRRFELSEAVDSHHPVAILSYDSWQNDFNADPDILTKKVSFSGVSYRIVGVTAESFAEPELSNMGQRTQVWLPWDFNPNTNLKDRWGSIINTISFIGKLSNQFTATQAEQILTPLINDIWRENVAGKAFFSGWSVKMELVSFQSAIMGDSRHIVYLLLAAVIGLVLIACANIANLFMSRTAEQQRTLAIKAVVGATREDLFKTLFAESFQLMTLSIIAALLISAAGFEFLQANLAEVLPRVAELKFNLITVLGAVILVFLLALTFSYLGSRMIDYRKLNASLQSSGKGNSIQVSKGIRELLVAAQVCVATALIFVNLNLLNDAVKSINKPLGFQVADLVDMRLSYSANQWPKPSEVVPVMDQIAEKLAELPQVEAVSRSGSPFSVYGVWGVTDVATNRNYTPEARSVSAQHFELLGQPLLEGNWFSEADIRDRNQVAIINDIFAQTLAVNGTAIGAKISRGWGKPYTVIGVVKSIHIPAGAVEPMRMYTPARLFGANMMIKLRAGQSIEPQQVIQVLKSVDSMFALYSLQSLQRNLDDRLLPQLAVIATSAILALLSLFLAAIGLYGILSYGTQMRRFEFGTRMAVGADGNDLMRLVLKDNSTPVLSGILLSIILMLSMAVGYSDVIAPYLTVELLWLLAATLFGISLIVLFACYLPLKSYFNRPPIHALRDME